MDAFCRNASSHKKMLNLTAFMFGQPTEWIVILVVVLLLFGPKKLPEFARSIGKSVGELKKGIDESKEQFSTAMNAEPVPATAPAAAAIPATAATAEAEAEKKPEVK